MGKGKVKEVIKVADGVVTTRVRAIDASTKKKAIATRGRENICSRCRVRLTRFKWNTKVDIFICNNEDCPKFRQPQRKVAVGEPDKLSVPI